MARIETPREFLRQLKRRGVVEVRQTGSHVIVRYGQRKSVVPMHNRDMKVGTRRAILRQLGIEDWG